jgi:hypothetical protein
MTAYWSAQAEAEQLRENNVAAPKLLLEKHGYLVTEVSNAEGTHLLYEQRVGPRLVRGFIRPRQWVWATTTSGGDVLIKAKEGPPAGPKVTPA